MYKSLSRSPWRPVKPARGCFAIDLGLKVSKTASKMYEFLIYGLSQFPQQSESKKVQVCII